MFFVLKLFSISLSQKFSFIELLTGGKSYVNRVSVSKKTKMKQRACVCVCVVVTINFAKVTYLFNQ